MNISIQQKEAQWIAVACARAQAKVPADSREAVAFGQALRHIIQALDKGQKVGHAKKN